MPVIIEFSRCIGTFYRKRMPAYLAPFPGSFFRFLFSVVGSIFYSTATSTYHFTNIAYLFYRTLSIKERSNQYRKRFHLMPVSSSCTHTGEENHSCRRHQNNSWISAVKYPGYTILLLPPVWSGAGESCIGCIYRSSRLLTYWYSLANSR